MLLICNSISISFEFKRKRECLFVSVTGSRIKNIERAVQNGVNSIRQLSDKLHLGTSCGCCVDYAEEYLKDRQLGSSLQEVA